MTAYELWRVATRRWYVLLAGILATVALVLTARPETVYWATVELTVAGPVDPVAPKTLEDPPSDTVGAAIMLMTRVNGGQGPPRSASPDATLYGEGQRQAVSARLRDVGGQWVNSVSDPIIDVQAVDVTPEAVLTRLSTQEDELGRLLRNLQDELAVAGNQRVTLVASPTKTDVVQVTGSRTRAVGSSALLGVVLTFTVLYWVELVLRRRWASSKEDHSEPGVTTSLRHETSARS